MIAYPVVEYTVTAYLVIIVVHFAVIIQFRKWHTNYVAQFTPLGTNSLDDAYPQILPFVDSKEGMVEYGLMT